MTPPDGRPSRCLESPVFRPDTLLSSAAIIGWYRRKNRVEEVFHEIKSPLALRPLFVSRTEFRHDHFMDP